ncbi:hypothetical protein CSB45_06660 [candidate division KSB3 bacterium]|uniref:Transglycosylase SLT domain-containing protein n=1 Tax=candidate division KSB3 bacterium TaxID=2044937 RepID=A0A2G6E613_9BACT|nr:MAG: hypothetical protein CSB45_06660 [candidate division KSB3 bacterium]PIE30084.1 MAG: hypothetical protein CSA57_05935 [candidate division KSB3 bacterium]
MKIKELLFSLSVLFVQLQLPTPVTAGQDQTTADRQFLQAYTQFQQERYVTAARLFQAVLETYPDYPLGDYAYLSLAESLVHSARYQEARTALRHLHARYPQSILLDDAAFLHADSWFYQGKPAQAVQAYVKIGKLKKYRRHPQLPLLHLKLAQAYEQEQRYQTALAQYHTTRLRFIASPVYESAKISEERLIAQAPTLLKFYTSTLLFDSIAKLINSGKAQDALAFIAILKARILSPAQHEKLALQNASAYYRLRKNLRAKALYRQFLRDFPKSKSAPYALDRLGRLSLREGDMQGFLRIYERLLKEYPASHYTASARRLKGKELMLLGQFQRAALEFKTFLQRHPKNPLTSDVVWNAGWCAYQLGRYSTAQRYLKRLLRSYPKSYHREEALYWAGRTAEQLKQYTTAVRYYQQVLNNRRNSYFGALSRDAILRLNTADPNLSMPLSSTKHKALPWQESVRFATQRGKRHFQKSLILERLGLSALAAREMDAAVSSDSRTQAQYLALARLYARSGQYHMLVRLMQSRFRDRIVQGDEDLPQEFWKLVYPLSFPHVVKRSAAQNNIDPALVLSLMYAESLFAPEAFSAAGAMGLMQLMPATGARLAQEEGLTVGSDQDYFQPQLNITLGTRYLRNLSELFGHHLPAVIAAYNAGEHRVIDWWDAERHPQDVARFISTIPYKETWRYVQKVLWYYREYHRVYGTKVF